MDEDTGGNNGRDSDGDTDYGGDDLLFDGCVSVLDSENGKINSVDRGIDLVVSETI